VLDEGDNASGGAGRIFTFLPTAPGDAFQAGYFQ